ncbi:hypothetical protein LUZ60_013215 [Juncus effusus]|nr:hypothetical protein LUZ60_013215 [Juncus effusus]
MAMLTFANSELIITRSLLSRGFVEPHRTHHGSAKKFLLFSALKSSVQSGELVGDEVMKGFLKERQLNGDFVSKAYDMLQKRNSDLNIDEFEFETSTAQQTSQLSDNASTTTAPQYKKLTFKDRQINSEKRKKLNLLQYEALKGELLFLTVGIGAACTVYCLLAFSIEAAVSYAAGVLFSCLYLQLLYNHTDNISQESVPEIFMIEKPRKKIGITSEDLRDNFKKTISGITLSLASPRLVIPASIYGIWAFSQHFHNDFFNFQLVPGAMGFFAYKAAALIQAYRDNENLLMTFPENEESDFN